MSFGGVDPIHSSDYYDKNPPFGVTKGERCRSTGGRREETLLEAIFNQTLSPGELPKWLTNFFSSIAQSLRHLHLPKLHHGGKPA